MLSNSESRVLDGLPLDLGGDCEDFALFTLDLGESLDHDSGQPLFPSLASQPSPSPLWTVAPIPQVDTMRQDYLKAIADNEAIRLANLAKYIERGYAFETPEGGDEDTPLTEEDFEGVSACPNCGESQEGCDYCQPN